jgi:dinuclear metal center YbgI/SA1388 family protein
VVTSTSPLSLIIGALERRYPLESAEPWDAVGLVCGDPDAEVTRVLWAVDPTDGVIDQAVEVGAQLIVTHHPLLLTGVHSVAATTPKGSHVHRLIRAGIALYCAHTNADVADPGVSDALAAALGVTGLEPLAPGDAPGTGLGRIGDISETVTLAEFAGYVSEALPATHHGVRVAGDPDRPVRRVAVCGGSGDSLLGVATALGADVMVTSDLKHHRALEHLEDDGCAIIDVAHWASEWPWLPQAARLLREDLAAEGTTVDCVVSDLPTDPWALTLRSAL